MTRAGTASETAAMRSEPATRAMSTKAAPSMRRRRRAAESVSVPLSVSLVSVPLVRTPTET
jgi:hypothetical protein